MKFGIVLSFSARILGLMVALLMFTGCETLQSGSKPGANGGAPAPAISDEIRVGEKLTIELRDTGTSEDRVFSQTVSENGTITLLYSQTVQAAGLKKTELEEKIHSLYVPRYFRRMTVVVRREALVFFVRGEVRGPGRVLYEGGAMTALRAIGSAGDFTDFANRKRIEIIRANGKKEKFNAVAALKNPELDVPIYPGDVVYVHRRFW